MSKKTRQSETRRNLSPVPAKSNRNRQANQQEQGNHSAFEPNAAGIDIGAREIYVAVPPDRDPQPVRKCETFTGDLHRMAEWLGVVASPQWRWSPRESIGFQCTTCWNDTAYNRVW